jgi:hypothetical protein
VTQPADLGPGDTQPVTISQAEKLRAMLAVVQREVALLRAQLPQPEAASKTAMQHAGGAVKWVTLAVGVLGIAAQVAAELKPGLVGPIQTLLQLLGGLQ